MKMRVNPNCPGIEKKLIPLNERTPEERHKIAVMGGSVKSLKKTRAAQLRGWKMKLKNSSLQPKDIQWIHEQIKNDKAMAMSMVEWCERIKGEVGDDPKLQIMLGKLMTDIFKSLHGERIKMQSINVNVNAGDSLADDILSRAFGKEFIDVESKNVKDGDGEDE